MTCKHFGMKGICLRSMNTPVNLATNEDLDAHKHERSSEGSPEAEFLKDPVKCPYDGDTQKCLDELIDLDLCMYPITKITGAWGDFVLWRIHCEDCEKYEKQKKKQKEEERAWLRKE